jgi:DNA-binding GntR family transcriptional regulator
MGSAGSAMERGAGEPIERQADVVHAALREAILSGDLPQGTVLSQIKLAKRFDVSRTPLREAVRMLQSEGLIDSVPNRRVRVSALSIGELEQLYMLRIAVEAVAIRVSVPHFTKDDFERMHRCLVRMDRHAASGDVSEWETPHKEFHETLVAYAGERVREVIGRLQDDASRYRRIYVGQEAHAWGRSASDHAALLEACEQGDPGAAAAELARHYGRTALAVIALMAPEHDPVPLRAALAMVLSGRPSS